MFDESVVTEIKKFYKWHEISNTPFCFDIDNNIFDKKKFLKTIQNLYSWLEFEDFNSLLIEQYYDQYMLLHSHG